MSGRLVPGRFGSRFRSRGLVSVLVSVVMVGAGVGIGAGFDAPTSDDQWATVMVDTCRSIIARARLRNPTAAELNTRRFLDERERLLASGRPFNTVSAFRRVCGAVRDEITTQTADPATLSDNQTTADRVTP